MFFLLWFLMMQDEPSKAFAEPTSEPLGALIATGERRH